MECIKIQDCLHSINFIHLVTNSNTRKYFNLSLCIANQESQWNVNNLISHSVV